MARPGPSPPAPTLPRRCAAALAKTGGTPFTAGEIEIQMEGGPWYLPGSAVNELRRQALDALLQKREVLHPWPVQPVEMPALTRRAAPARPALWARFETWAQVPAEAWTGWKS